MTDMPIDILNRRLGQIRDNGDIDFDNTAIALDIDTELQEKFIIIPLADIDEVEIDDNPDNTRFKYQAGSGPEAIRAMDGDNPNWLYNSALHALAMYRHLEQRQKLEQRPEPGVYQGKASAGYFAVIVTADQRVLVQQEQGGYRDVTESWDLHLKRSGLQIWPLQRVDITDGTVEK